MPASGGLSVVEAGHFTAPYPRATAYSPSQSVLGTLEVGAIVTEELHTAGSTVAPATLLGDLAYPPTERKGLLNTDLPIDVAARQIVLESRARNRGKKWFNRLRHHMRTTWDVNHLFEHTGGLLLRGPGDGQVSFTATPAAARFPQPPYLSTIANGPSSLPLCTLIIAGKLLCLGALDPELVVVIYDRRDDVDIRAKNFWGGCLFYFLAGLVEPERALPRLVNLTLVSDEAAWLDLLESHPGPSPAIPTIEHVLDYLRFAANVEVRPYLWIPKKTA